MSSNSQRRYFPQEADAAVAQFTYVDMLRALWYFLRGRRARLFFYLSIVIVCVVAMIIPPYALGKLGEMLLAHQPGADTSLFYVYLAALGAGITIFGLARNIARRKLRELSLEMYYDARVEGFERLMNFSYTWHQEESSGVRVQRITTGGNELRNLMRMVYREGVDTAIILIGVVGLFALVSWWAVLFFVFYLICMVTTERFYNRKLQELTNQQNAAGEKTSGTYYESASNALTVKALGVQEGIKQSVVRNEEVAKQKALEVTYLSSQKYLVYQFIRGFGLAGFLSIVAYQVFQGSLSAPLFLTYFVYFNRMSESVGDFSELLTDVATVKVGIARMMPIYWSEQVQEGEEKIPAKWKFLEFRDVSFTYPGSEAPALRDINMSIERGKKIGIVGRSGDGKSTLAKLLLSVYAPSSGSILIGGVSLSEVQGSERLHRISAVLQETELFSLSLRENIELFRGSDEKRMALAVKIAQLDEVINELPQGIDTLIGEKGYKLSGGQRQRVGIARAVYAHSDIIVMDEATAALDSTTELAVQKGIDEDLEGRTIIMIAHRLSTLRSADTIYVVDDGRIVESGTFDELLSQNGLFKQQYQLQQRGQAD